MSDALEDAQRAFLEAQVRLFAAQNALFLTAATEAPPAKKAVKSTKKRERVVSDDNDNDDDGNTVAFVCAGNVDAGTPCPGDTAEHSKPYVNSKDGSLKKTRGLGATKGMFATCVACRKAIMKARKATKKSTTGDAAPTKKKGKSAPPVKEAEHNGGGGDDEEEEEEIEMEPEDE